MNYTIQSGDTLGNIAAKHGVSVEALMMANGIMNPNQILAGQMIYIPAPHHHVPAAPPHMHHHMPIAHHPHHPHLFPHHHIHHRIDHLEHRIHHLEQRIQRMEHGHPHAAGTTGASH